MMEIVLRCEEEEEEEDVAGGNEMRFVRRSVDCSSKWSLFFS